MAFTTKFGANGLNVYSDGVLMGILSTTCDKVTFRQWSNSDQIYDVDLAKQFLTEEWGYTKFKVNSGLSTATQKWFSIEAT